MAFPKRQAAIVGTYTTAQARNLERTSLSLEIEAIKARVAPVLVRFTALPAWLASPALVPGRLVTVEFSAGRTGR